MANDDMTTTISGSNPFDFRLSNQQGQTVLFTRLIKQDMHLELCNTSRSKLTIPAGKPKSTAEPTQDDCHLQLRFRSGTLWEPAMLVLNDADWIMSSPQSNAGVNGASENPDDVVFYLRFQGAVPLALDPGQWHQLLLQNIAVDGRSGSHGTRVELKYQNLMLAGSDVPLSGTRMHYVSVLDESPADEPGNDPVTIGWIGANTFLNDGSTETMRTLRLYNNSGVDLKLDAAARIRIDLPASDDNADWPFLRRTDITSVKLEGLGRWKKASNSKQSNNLHWMNIELKTSAYLFKAKDTINIPLTLRTASPSGTSHIRVHYEGFSHLQGTREIEVVKTPVVVWPRIVGKPATKSGQFHVGRENLVIDNAGNMGVSTASPTARLHVNGRIKDKTGEVMPVGTILVYAGKKAPEGWLFCRGQNKWVAGLLAELASVLGDEYKQPDQQGKGVFQVPDLRKKFVTGSQGTGEYKFAATGGKASVTLNKSQMPRHNHSVYDPGHTHTYDCTNGAHYNKDSGDTRKTFKWDKGFRTDRAKTGISLYTTGESKSHENRPPFVALNYIIKY